jgi:excisionase family DNA binding protein
VQNRRLMQVPAESNVSRRCLGNSDERGVGLQRAVARHRERPVDRDSGMNDPLLTAHEVGDLLGVPASWVYEQSRRGRIPTVTLGRYRRYRREAIEAWITQLEASARGARAYSGPPR